MDFRSSDNMGMRLLKKSKKGFFRTVFSRSGIFSVLVLTQLAIIISVFGYFSEFTAHYFVLTSLLYGGSVIYVINSQTNPTAKITWIVLIMLVPVLGVGLLLYTKNDFGHRAIKHRVENIVKETDGIIEQNSAVIQALAEESPETVSLSNFINRGGCYPVYDDTSIKYFPQGEDKFDQLLIELEKAEHFIFLEYFIIDEGLMWGKVLDILARKARDGVEVRLMYDGTCEFTTLPHNYPERLKALGINCKMFSPVTPFVSTHYNYRDHRKILVIDGHTAFTGGINLADEYINEITRFGHWKDTAIMLKGEAVKSFTLMFLQLWNVNEKTPEFGKYLEYPSQNIRPSRGYVIPYGDCPLDNEKVGEMVYIDILNRAQNYVHIMSPYLILDGETETALKFAAERGVDVSLILPGIPDKKYAFALAKTHYASLLESGVKIYEYTPGFVHAKVFVSDDVKAVVGTINLDYRSLYHHFECAAYMYGTDCISDIEADFQNTLKKCREITNATLKSEKPGIKIAGRLLKIIAPLM